MPKPQSIDIQGLFLYTTEPASAGFHPGPIHPPFQTTAYSESANSLRPGLEFRYSFLWARQCLVQSREVRDRKVKKRRRRRKRGRGGKAVPLDGPVQGVVEEDHGGRPVQDLVAEPPPGVEDGVVGGAGEGVLSVRA